MAGMKRALSSPTSPSPARTRNSSLSLSVIQSSPLSSGSLISYPVTTASFESSPNLSESSDSPPDSPNYFEPFEYTPEMALDFERIDAVGSQLEGDNPSSSTEIPADIPPPTQANSPPPPADTESPPPTLHRKQKTWVVFQGREPGVYDCVVLASFQTQGFSDNFQRTYPDREAADAAWFAYVRDGTFPDYGRPPWVIFIGRRVGVTEKVTELEGSVKNYKSALFRSCSSITEGNIKLQLFFQHVTELFAGADPFPGADTLVTQTITSARSDCSQEEPLVRSITPTPISHQHYPRTPEVAGSSGLARSDADHALSAASSTCTCHTRAPHPSEGWYVAYRATLPGIYQGLAFSRAGARPGGFQCVPDGESANCMYLELATNGMITWAGMDEQE